MWFRFSSSLWQLCGQPEIAFQERAESLVHRGQYGGGVTHADRGSLYISSEDNLGEYRW